MDHPTQALINFASDGREIDNLDAREIRTTVRDGKIRPPTNLVQRKNKQWGRSHSSALSGIFLAEDGSPWYLHQWTECGTGNHMNTLERSEPGDWKLQIVDPTPVIREIWSRDMSTVNYKLRISRTAMEIAADVNMDIARLLLPKRVPAAVRVVDDCWRQLWFSL